MELPIKPKLPKRPYPPKEFLDNPCRLYMSLSNYSTYSLLEIVNYLESQCDKKLDLSKINISIQEGHSQDDYSDSNASYTEECKKKNPNYESQLEKYNKKIIQYNEKLKEYKAKLKEYPAKLKAYRIEQARKVLQEEGVL